MKKDWIKKGLLALIAILLIVIITKLPDKEESKKVFYSYCYINGRRHSLVFVDRTKNYIEVDRYLYINPVVECYK